MTEEADIYELLEAVKDPEIPVLSVVDLGIVRKVDWISPKKLKITITPTYSGCPAMDTIEREISEILQSKGFEVEVVTSISEAWTTDWISEKGRKNLEEYGIAPPAEATTDKSFITGNSKNVHCPRCKSEETSLISQFGSTACKALYKCDSCHETFDYFKCI
ncbi:MAG: 1,2-phenylacetyl-CoA epoxidase subunit PaaD [Cryomorphaceae bacterium]|nr:phenylacetate-CoA oxygenase subunit PaaJ [Flavobacteriales bacterium]